MFAAGVVLYLNTHPNGSVNYRWLEVVNSLMHVQSTDDLNLDDAKFGVSYQRVRKFGWPFVCLSIVDFVNLDDGHWIVREQSTDKPSLEKLSVPFLFYALGLDLACALAIILASAVAAEFLARRFAKQNR